MMMNTFDKAALAQFLHERICQLYARLEGGEVLAMSLAQFDREAGYREGRGEDRKTIMKRLVDALVAYEEASGGKEHPVSAELADL